jgi:3-deoxy-D-manno-octulosonic-acid transferase
MISPGGQVIWVHCASLGEFEQGRPLMEEIRKKYPSSRLLLSFFSPSGYEVQKGYNGADWVIYMPLDGPRTAKRFLEIVKPRLVIFIKYEFWFYYLKKIKYRGIPLLLVSAYFRENMNFFKWHGSLQRKMLSRFDQLFVQDEHSKQLLDKIGFSEITTVSGDTRFDRVIQIADEAQSIPVVEKFIGSSLCLVAGSSWPGDEKLLAETFAGDTGMKVKLIIAPHEVDETHLAEIEKLFPGATRFSSPDHSKNVMIIDNIGLLARLYKYGTMCYVGGGLHPGGVHNVLEAAVYGKVVFFGTNHQKYREAVGLAASGGGIVITCSEELSQQMEKLLNESPYRKELEQRSREYVARQAGATSKVVDYIQEKRLLTS